jgi:hypothetical protein
VLTDGSRRFVPKSSGQALGVADASTLSGAALVQQRWQHVLNQQWSLEWADGAGVPPITGSGGTADSGGTSGGSAGAGGGTAGVAGAGGTLTASGGSSAGTSAGGAASSGTQRDAEESSGCGCRVPATRGGPRALAVLFLLCGGACRSRVGRRSQALRHRANSIT